MKNHFNAVTTFRPLLTISLFILALFVISFGISCYSQAPAASPPAPSPVLPTEPTTGPQTNFKVAIEGFSFKPPQLDIPVGTAVTWTNNDSAPHAVTARDNSFDSGRLPKGATFNYTFKQSDVFEYYCKVHPSMVGKVTVK